MNRYRNRGFTLIELLIVIALIGVLAVALLSTINPVEQPRKAKDTARGAAAAEMLSALERFQATFFCYPWDIDFAASTPSCGDIVNPDKVPLNEADTIADLTVNTSEMKPEFFNRDVVTDTGTNKLQLTEDTTNLVHICYVPESATQKQQANNDAAGGGSASTHVCVPE
jgi:prepilin-type N-terminal cleavage/methylation domain-containing protein